MNFNECFRKITDENEDNQVWYCKPEATSVQLHETVITDREAGYWSSIHSFATALKFYLRLDVSKKCNGVDVTCSCILGVKRLSCKHALALRHHLHPFIPIECHNIPFATRGKGKPKKVGLALAPSVDPTNAGNLALWSTEPVAQESNAPEPTEPTEASELTDDIRPRGRGRGRGRGRANPTGQPTVAASSQRRTRGRPPGRSRGRGRGRPPKRN